MVFRLRVVMQVFKGSKGIFNFDHAESRMNKPLVSCAAMAASIVWSMAALANPVSEEEELALAYGDKNTVSIATGSPQALRRAPAVTSVITAEDIAATGATKLDEVLEIVPGMHVSHASIRYMPLYLMRGMGVGNQTNPQMLMLQNGIPMTTMYNGDTGSAWIGLPLDNIARIEIIRGPGSALYGADAYAGVINVITKAASDISVNSFNVRSGSFKTRDAWAQYGGKWGDVDVAAYLHKGHTDGIKEIITADAQTANDTRFGTNASLAPGPTNTGYDATDANLDFSHGNWRMRSSYKLRENLETGAGISSALDPTSSVRAQNITADLSWNDQQFSQDMSAGVTLGVLYYSLTCPTNLMLLPAGAQVGATTFNDGLIGGPNQWERQYRLSANGTYTGFADHNVRVGLGHDHLDMYRTKTIKNYTLSATGVPINPGPVQDYTDIQPHILPHLRKVDYVYVQDEWTFDHDWTLTAGLRHDDYSDFGSTTNPRLALVWDAAFDLTAKLLYGAAFRAPSFNEQYGINPVAGGNPNLRPETVKTIEAVLAWKASKDIQLNWNIFRSDMQQIIRLVPNAAPAVGSSYANTGAQHATGMELEAIWDAGRDLRLTGNYAYQKAIDEVTGQDAGYTPHHHLYARADWSFAGGWLHSTQVNRVADRRRAAGDARPQVPDYTTVDMTVRSDTKEDVWNLALSVRNLFNADVREPTLAPGTAIPNDLPMARRSLYVQAELKL